MKKKENDSSYWMPICMSLGMCIGVGIGAAVNNIAIYLPIGMCLGLSIGVVLDEVKKKNKKK